MDRPINRQWTDCLTMDIPTQNLQLLYKEDSEGFSGCERGDRISLPRKLGGLTFYLF